MTTPTASTSNITYTPPPEVPQAEITAFQDDLSKAISDIGDEYAPKPAFSDEELAAPDGEPTPEVPVEAPVEPQEDAAVARGMERLVAREVALQARETAFQSQQTAFQAVQQELAQLKAKQPAQDVVAQFEYSPSEAIKALGHDPEHVVRIMIAEQLKAKGQEVPQALREALASAENRRMNASSDAKIKALEAKLLDSQKAQAAAAFFNQVDVGAHEYVKSVGKEMPTLAEIAKANPARAHREIMEEITRDAKQRMAADPNGQPLSYAEAAKLVEARLTDYKTLLGPAQNVSPTKPAVGARTSPPQPQPPVAPLKPWQKKGDDVLADAIRDAERAFHQVEQAQKRRV